jgi:hypothetical protein
MPYSTADQLPIISALGESITPRSVVVYSLSLVLQGMDLELGTNRNDTSRTPLVQRTHLLLLPTLAYVGTEGRVLPHRDDLFPLQHMGHGQAGHDDLI